MLIQYDNEYLDLCIDLFLDVFKNNPWNFNWIQEQRIRKYFIDMEKTPMSKNFLYMKDKLLLGMCFGVVNDYFANKSYDIKEILIARNKQSQGLGTKFLINIEEELKKEEVTTITLMTQRDIQAFKFYEKNGYSVSNGTVHMGKIIK